MDISHVLKEKRKNAGLTQEQLAKQLFVSPRTISNWETGRTVPDLASIMRLATFYNMSLDELLIQGSQTVKQITYRLYQVKWLYTALVAACILIIILAMEGRENTMDKVSISIGSILIIAFVLYFVIKWAVKQAIIEAKVDEKPLSLQYQIDSLYGVSMLMVSFIDDFTTLSSEQQKHYKKIEQALNKRVNECYISEDEVGEKYREMQQLLTEKKIIHQEIIEEIGRLK